MSSGVKVAAFHRSLLTQHVYTHLVMTKQNTAAPTTYSTTITSLDHNVNMRVIAALKLHD